MSTDYNVYCKTCDDIHRFNDANHQDDLMRALVRHKAAIAALAPLLAEASVELVTPYGYVSADWFAQHAAHDLAVIDEYGRVPATTCARCAKPDEQCRAVFVNSTRLYCDACAHHIERGART